MGFADRFRRSQGGVDPESGEVRKTGDGKGHGKKPPPPPAWKRAEKNTKGPPPERRTDK